uniref:Putative phosphatidylinositol-4-phosphate binding protein n=1 Tax=Phytophthora sojae TaxID=67593 RepID=Q6TA23_PHYSO|nr:putative phosphatidylinositol-4-phosphate binding protein [Phytophthora sojae]
MAALCDISLVIDSQNITKRTLALEKNWVPNESRSCCTVCSRKFHKLHRRRQHCRMCGDVICKTCYVTRSVPAANTDDDARKCKFKGSGATRPTKVCVRCVMDLRGVDKRLNNFSPNVSKMLLVGTDSTDAKREPAVGGCALKSADSFFTFYELGASKNSAADLNQLQIVPSLALTGIDGELENKASSSSFRATDSIGGIGAMVSVGSWASKRTGPSFSTNPAHSSSSGRLRGPSQLSRRSSTSSGADKLEEKVNLQSNKIHRVVAI